MTISSCIQYCNGRNKTYAGAQNGGKCFCGDTYGKYGHSNECKVNCPGDTSYYCGGILQNSIYSACPIGRYGTLCDKECHCSKDASCNLSDGSCPTGCAPGWSGTQCAVTAASTSQLAHYGCFADAKDNGFPELFNDLAACQDGYYGVLCSHQCHCINGSNCTMEDGRCPGGCSEGWKGVSCNIRNCAENNGNCTGENVVCTYENTGEGSERVVPRCRCKEGYTRDMEYQDCQDINECAPTWPNNECNSNFGTCINLSGTYNCMCKAGFENSGSKVCKDIDECLLPSNRCNPASGECNNLEGAYTCECKTGFQNVSSTECEDIDECALTWPNNECYSGYGNCVNLVGTYKCECKAGFQNNGSKLCEVSTTSCSSSIIAAITLGVILFISLVTHVIQLIFLNRIQRTKHDQLNRSQPVVFDTSTEVQGPTTYEELRRNAAGINGQKSIYEELTHKPSIEINQLS